MNRKQVHPLTTIGAIIVLMYIQQVNPRAGWVGVGLVLALGAAITWLRREKIWMDYKKQYKKSGSRAGKLLNQPRDIYYVLNVWLVLPLAFLSGLLALYYAWKLV